MIHETDGYLIGYFMIEIVQQPRLYLLKKLIHGKFRFNYFYYD